MPTFRSGKFGTATVNGANELPTVSWEVDPSVSVIDFRNSKTGNFPYREATFFDCSVSIVLDIDFDLYPFAAPANIIVGQLITAKLYLRQTAPSTFSGHFWEFPKPATPNAGLIVVTNPHSMVIDGKNGTSFACLTTGPFNYPTGLTPALNQ